MNIYDGFYRTLIKDMSSDLILYVKISRWGSWIYSSYSVYLDKSDSVS